MSTRAVGMKGIITMKEVTLTELEKWVVKKGFIRTSDFRGEPHYYYKIDDNIIISWITYDNDVLSNHADGDKKYDTYAETKVYIKNVLKEIKQRQKFLAYLSQNPLHLVDNKITLSRHSVHFLNSEINMLVNYKCAIETCEKYF